MTIIELVGCRIKQGKNRLKGGRIVIHSELNPSIKKLTSKIKWVDKSWIGTNNFDQAMSKGLRIVSAPNAKSSKTVADSQSKAATTIMAPCQYLRLINLEQIMCYMIHLNSNRCSIRWYLIRRYFWLMILNKTSQLKRR